MVIINPLPGGAAFTSSRAARQAVERGAAEWVDFAQTMIHYRGSAERLAEIRLAREMNLDDGCRGILFRFQKDRGCNRRRNELTGYAGWSLVPAWRVGQGT